MLQQKSFLYITKPITCANNNNNQLRNINHFLALKCGFRLWHPSLQLEQHLLLSIPFIWKWIIPMSYLRQQKGFPISFWIHSHRLCNLNSRPCLGSGQLYQQVKFFDEFQIILIKKITFFIVYKCKNISYTFRLSTYSALELDCHVAGVCLCMQSESQPSFQANWEAHWYQSGVLLKPKQYSSSNKTCIGPVSWQRHNSFNCLRLLHESVENVS